MALRVIKPTSWRIDSDPKKVILGFRDATGLTEVEIPRDWLPLLIAALQE